MMTPKSYCQFWPSFRGYGLTASSGKIIERPRHSHSIVSEITDQWFLLGKYLPSSQFTVRIADKQSRSEAIDGDRSGNTLSVFERAEPAND